MAEDNVVVAFQPLAKAIDDLIAEYGADRPDHQYQPLMLPMIDVKRIRAAIATQAHEPSADVVERVRSILASQLRGGMAEIEPDTFVGNISDDQLTRVAAAIAAMRPEIERAGIVAWLRAQKVADNNYAEYFARQIERGDHIKEPSHD